MWSVENAECVYSLKDRVLAFFFLNGNLPLQKNRLTATTLPSRSVTTGKKNSCLEKRILKGMDGLLILLIR